MTEVSELFRSYTMSQNDRTGKIVGHFSCPHQLGNRLFDFLNAFLIAVVTDRALVWRPCRAVAHGICPRNRPDACAGVLDLRAWVGRPATARLSTRLPRLTRPAFRGPPGYWAHTRRPISWRAAASTAFRRHAVPGVLERNDAAALAWPGATLGAAAGAACRALCAARRWRTARRSTPPSTSRDSSASGNRAPVLGVHLRHYSARDGGRSVGVAADCVGEALADVPSRVKSRGRPCELLVATDRNVSVEFLRASIGRATGCAIVVAERRSAAAAATERGLTREHGPLAGVAAVGDLALLARATDGFVGSAQSSFSVLAWAVASSRRRGAAAAHAAGLPARRQRHDPVDAHGARRVRRVDVRNRMLPPLPHPTNWVVYTHSSSVFGSASRLSLPSEPRPARAAPPPEPTLLNRTSPTSFPQQLFSGPLHRLVKRSGSFPSDTRVIGSTGGRW